MYESSLVIDYMYKVFGRGKELFWNDWKIWRWDERGIENIVFGGIVWFIL